MFLCLLAGLDTFAAQLQGRNVHVHSDNTGAQHTAARGVAKSFDHTCLVHGIWMRALELGIGIYVGRVPTQENLSDCPSREEYGLLERVGAIRVTPWLSEHFRKAQSWEALSMRARGFIQSMGPSLAE